MLEAIFISHAEHRLWGGIRSWLMFIAWVWWNRWQMTKC